MNYIDEKELASELVKRIEEEFNGAITAELVKYDEDRLVFGVPNSNMKPSFKINFLYDCYAANGGNERAFNYVLKSLFNIAENELSKHNDEVKEKLEWITSDYSHIKDYLSTDLVAYEDNKDWLETVPFVKHKDLAMFYRIDGKCIGMEDHSIRITNDLLQNYGISHMQLHRDAINASLENDPISLQKRIKPAGINVDRDVFVLTNDSNYKGASAIFYPNFMNICSDWVGGSYYIIPTSVHEMMLIPDGDIKSPEEITYKVALFNNQNENKEDVLIDNAYHYDHVYDLFETVDEFIDRTMPEQIDLDESIFNQKDDEGVMLS